MKVAILGSSGMLGSMVLKVFLEATDYDIVATCREDKHFSHNQKIQEKILDARSFSTEQIKNVIVGCDYVINCIGIIKTELDESDADDIQKAIEVNALFPHKLQKVAKDVGAKVIQIATDCVYDGKKGGYLETDAHDAVDVYGKTKSLGEVKADNFINLRCSIIGPEVKGKKSLLEWFLNQPKGTCLKGFENHRWNGVTTYHFARICIGIIKNELTISNSQHIVPLDTVSKAKMLQVFASVFSREDIEIKSFNTEIGIDRTISTQFNDINQIIWKSAGYDKILDFEEMISELKSNLLF